MDDKKLLDLIELAVLDTTRKELYQQALPKMPAEEKLRLMVGLYGMWMTELSTRTKSEMDGMISEMALNDDVNYTKEDFAKVQDRVAEGMMKERVGVEEVSQLEAIRNELHQIHDIVQAHEKDLTVIKDKLL